jgi:hypothetical protein
MPGPLTFDEVRSETLPGLTSALTGRRVATDSVDFEISRIEIAGRFPSPVLVWIAQQLYLRNGRWYMLTKRKRKPYSAHNPSSRWSAL